MLSSFPRLQLSLSQFQKYIPRSWKQRKTTGLASFELKNSPLFCDCAEVDDEFLAHSLLQSVRNFAREGDVCNAFKSYSLLLQQRQQQKLLFLSLFTLHAVPTLISSCTKLKLLGCGRLLHAHVIVLGHEQNLIVVPKLVALYSSCGVLDEARFITENSNLGHAVPWNILMSAYVRHGSYKEVLCAYDQMVDMGIKPDNFTYPSVLKACGHQFDLNFGMKVHSSIAYRCLQWCTFVQNSLVSMYFKCGELNVARSLFEKMPVKDVVSWNSMISGYASNGMWDEAFELFDRMWGKNVQLNIVTGNIIAGGCLRMGNYEGVLGLISQMRSNGISLDSVTMVIGLAVCSRVGLGKLGKEIHGSVIRECYDEVENVKNALITMYSSCKGLRHAYTLFRSMKTKSLITWNSMIAGYTSHQFEEASSIFREMLSFGFEPNYVTIASILRLCARLANLQHGRELHCHILKHKCFVECLLLCNCLVDLYSKSGRMLEAQRVFDYMGKKDKITYTSLLAGYGMQRGGHIALKLFEEMYQHGIEPDDITMVSVLSACSHSRLVSDGRKLFEKMESVYHIRPRVEHYACMVDLFCRAGLLNQAVHVIMEMPFEIEQSPAIWASIIEACRINKNRRIGEWAADKLLEMRPEKLGLYVLIANMYAAVESWNKLEKVKALIRAMDMRNSSTCAWSSVGSEDELLQVSGCE